MVWCWQQAVAAAGVREVVHVCAGVGTCWGTRADLRRERSFGARVARLFVCLPWLCKNATAPWLLLRL